MPSDGLIPGAEAKRTVEVRFVSWFWGGGREEEARFRSRVSIAAFKEDYGTPFTLVAVDLGLSLPLLFPLYQGKSIMWILCFNSSICSQC
jgi:hypothetical protein